MSDIGRYLRPDTLGSIKRLDLKARILVEAYLAGQHKSPSKGFSTEFSGYRNYVRGDDPKLLDWKVYGRTDKYYIREFEAESNLLVTLVVDTSESMAYASGAPLSKLEYAIHIGAALGYLATRQNDPVGLITFGNGVRVKIPPKSGLKQLGKIIRCLAATKHDPSTRLSESLHQAAGLLKKKGLVILLSDMLNDESEDLENAIGHLKFKGHDIVLFHLLDPRELDLKFDTTVWFEDMEATDHLLVEPDAIREHYQKLINEWCDSIQDLCKRMKIHYYRIGTDQSFDIPLRNYLMNRVG